MRGSELAKVRKATPVEQFLIPMRGSEVATGHITGFAEDRS